MDLDKHGRELGIHMYNSNSTTFCMHGFGYQPSIGFSDCMYAGDTVSSNYVLLVFSDFISSGPGNSRLQKASTIFMPSVFVLILKYIC